MVNTHAKGLVVGSYGAAEGLYELGVLRKNDSGFYELCYSTPVASDVIGFLKPKEVEVYLKQISELPAEVIA